MGASALTSIWRYMARLIARPSPGLAQCLTDQALKALYIARDEAVRLGAGQISSDHLLLGILREPYFSAVSVVVALGAQPTAIRADVERQRAGMSDSHTSASPDRDGPTRKEMAFALSTRRAVNLAFHESRRFGHKFIGTEHILLGMLRNTEGQAAPVLGRAGITLRAARTELLRQNLGRSDVDDPLITWPPPPTPPR